MKAAPAALALALALPACADTTVHQSAAAEGATIADNPGASRSRYNVFACTTCHAVHAADVGTRILPGAPLEGAARRASYWGGEVTHLHEAVERCWTFFMRGTPTDLDGQTGEALYAWLESISPDGSTVGTEVVPRTWPRSVSPLGDGDAAAGNAVWARACANCHGTVGPGTGRLGPLITAVPDETRNEHCADVLPSTFTDHTTYMRTVVVEKVRHGSFLGYAGTMPPFAVEALSDDDVRNLTALFPACSQ